MEKRVAALGIGLAAAVPWLLGARWESLLLAGVAAGGCWWGFRRAGWLEGERRISRVSWQAEGHWLLTDAQGRECTAVLQADTRVACGLIWLRWNTQAGINGGAVRAGKRGGTHSMLLTSGDIPQSQLRRLGVRLRLSGCNDSGTDVIGQLRTLAI